MSKHIEYDILNGKKIQRLLLAYMDHVKILADDDLLSSEFVGKTGLSKADALDLTIIQKIGKK